MLLCPSYSCMKMEMQVDLLPCHGNTQSTVQGISVQDTLISSLQEHGAFRV